MRPSQTAFTLKSFNQLCEKIHLTEEENWYISADENAVVLSYVGDNTIDLAFWFVKRKSRKSMWGFKLVIDGYFINPNNTDDPFLNDACSFEKDDIEFLKKNLLVF